MQQFRWYYFSGIICLLTEKAANYKDTARLNAFGCGEKAANDGYVTCNHLNVRVIVSWNLVQTTELNSTPFKIENLSVMDKMIWRQLLWIDVSCSTVVCLNVMETIHKLRTHWEGGVTIKEYESVWGRGRISVSMLRKLKITLRAYVLKRGGTSGGYVWVQWGKGVNNGRIFAYVLYGWSHGGLLDKSSNKPAW